MKLKRSVTCETCRVVAIKERGNENDMCHNKSWHRDPIKEEDMK